MEFKIHFSSWHQLQSDTYMLLQNQVHGGGPTFTQKQILKNQKCTQKGTIETRESSENPDE